MGVLKLMNQKYYGLKGNMNFFKFIRDPYNTHTIFHMNENLKKSVPLELLEQMHKTIFCDVQLEKDFQNRYWPKMASFEEMEQMPEGSLGKETTEFIKRWNLDKNIFPEPQFSDRSDYLLSRIYQSHDLWHVLTGYTTELKDEMALQAFGVGQYHQPLSLLIVTGGLMHILKNNPLQAEQCLIAVSEGYERGNLAKNFLTSKIIERMDEPLEKLRTDLNIRPRKNIFTPTLAPQSLEVSQL